ncbi:MAG TPA: deoxyribodipyrimidine photo-lyase, partial [Terriglobales bacterium]
MSFLVKISGDARVTVRRSGAPDPDGSCVIYWMQRAQRAWDNPALDVAVRVANELRKPLVVFFAPVPFYPGANQRHFAFLADGIPDIAQ